MTPSPPPSPSVDRFPCPQCGSELFFNPQVGKLKCDYCGWEEVSSAANTTSEAIIEHDYEQYFQVNQTQLAVLSSTALEVSCNNCGGKITFEPPRTAGKCPFCAAAIVAQPKSADPTLAPGGIIPFKLGRKDAQKQIQTWLKSLWFAPNALKKIAQLEKINGIYLPFFTYDAQTRSNYQGERGDYYYTTETYTETNEKGQRETKTRQVRHTRWRSASGRVSRFFDDVLIAATTLVDRARLDSLEPWALKESLRPYQSSYLAGFEAQRPQLTLQEGFTLAKQVMAITIDGDVRRDIGGDEQRVHNISTDYSEIKFKPILLPVWLCSYRFNNKQYQVLINAKTGEVQGDRPYSWLKIAIAVIVGLLVAAVIIVIIIRLAS